jgi:bacterioferritin (cytochrome b1)
LEEKSMADPKTYVYNGQNYGSEREMLLALLENFRAGEVGGEKSLRAWCAACQIPALRGGLRTIVEREASHARVLAQRLQEIGGQCPAQVQETSRETTLPDVSDADKLRELLGYLSGSSDPVAELRRTVLQVEEDQESRALLLTMLDDEDATVRWLRETCRDLTNEPTDSTRPAC